MVPSSAASDYGDEPYSRAMSTALDVADGVPVLACVVVTMYEK